MDYTPTSSGLWWTLQHFSFVGLILYMHQWVWSARKRSLIAVMATGKDFLDSCSLWSNHLTWSRHQQAMYCFFCSWSLTFYSFNCTHTFDLGLKHLQWVLYMLCMPKMIFSLQLLARLLILYSFLMQMQVTTGRYHTLLLHKSSVYSCGSSLSGVLGHSAEITQCVAFTPISFPYPAHVLQVSASHNHAAFVMQSGEVWNCSHLSCNYRLHCKTC